MVSSFASIDLGATSGRVVLGRVGPSELKIREVGRFANAPVHEYGPGPESTLRWNAENIWAEVGGALRVATGIAPDLRGVAVDSWGVDYGLLREGKLIDLPFHYRDGRTAVGVRRVTPILGAERMYRSTGIQPMPINTVYQLGADLETGRLAEADTVLLIPDLIRYWLTGERAAERTIASTTGLLGVSGEWDSEIVAALGIPRDILPPVVGAGTSAAPLLPGVAAALGAGPALQVAVVGSHDTASAVAATPLDDDASAYISCGTWGLVGAELETPHCDDASLAAGFSNERGVDDRVCFLRSLMGLWLLDQVVRAWESRDGHAIDLRAMLRAASDVSGEVSLLDPEDPSFATPGDMLERITVWYAKHDLAAPRSRAELVRALVESLAQNYANTLRDLSRVTGRHPARVHLVGGGSRNRLLCQAIANRSGLPVHAGPAEATAIGNILVQARAAGVLSGDLDSLRDIVRRTTRPRVHSPQGAV